MNDWIHEATNLGFSAPRDTPDEETKSLETGYCNLDTSYDDSQFK